MNFIKGNIIKQASFHNHFENDKHHGMSDWEITLIDQTDTINDLRRREPFWQYELEPFHLFIYLFIYLVVLGPIQLQV